MVIVVEIEDRCLAKPFLGGWRNVVTGTEYHDARTQTCPGDNIVYPTGSSRKKTKDDLANVAATAGGGGGSCVNVISNVITKTRDCCVGTDTSVLMVVLASYRCKYTSVALERATQTSRLPDVRDKLLTPLAAKTVSTSSTSNLDKATGLRDTTRTDECREKQINERVEINFYRLKEDSAMKIQKCYRNYRARLDIKALARLSRETRAQTPPKPEKIHHFRHCRTSQFEIVNLVPPKKRSDFEMLENILERWRFYENARLDCRDFFVTSKLAARASILQREIKLLRSIETIKTRVRDETRERCTLEFLDKLAESEIWSVANGNVKIHVDTLRVQRAREFRDFYRSLQNHEADSPIIIDRMEILQKLRKYTSVHTCKYAKDVVSLIDQEIELFALNCDEKIMNSLRNRLAQALLRLTMNFCATDQRKFDVSRKLPISRVNNGMKKSSFSRTKLCKRCGKFLTPEALTSSRIVSPSYELLATCENCRQIQPVKESKIVYEPYDIMLRDLRIHENELCRASSSSSSSSSIRRDDSACWCVDSRIIYRLVNHVWHGKSAISECDDLYRLALVRFRSECQWSPWNNVLLTKREAALHRSMREPREIYASTIIKKFVVKNLQARLRFDFGARINFH